MRKLFGLCVVVVMGCGGNDDDWTIALPAELVAELEQTDEVLTQHYEDGNASEGSEGASRIAEFEAQYEAVATNKDESTLAVVFTSFQGAQQADALWTADSAFDALWSRWHELPYFADLPTTYSREVPRREQGTGSLVELQPSCDETCDTQLRFFALGTLIAISQAQRILDNAGRNCPGGFFELTQVLTCFRQQADQIASKETLRVFLGLPEDPTLAQPALVLSIALRSISDLMNTQTVQSWKTRCDEWHQINCCSATGSVRRYGSSCTDENEKADSNTCGSDQFECDDGSCIAASVACNSTNDCADGEDEASELCGQQDNCCVATAGCPGETGHSCGNRCCCCPAAQACCAAD